MGIQLGFRAEFELQQVFLLSKTLKTSATMFEELFNQNTELITVLSNQS